MSKLLRDILFVIKTFHKYSRADVDRTSLTHYELKQLLEGELGHFLEPHDFRDVERKLNLLDFDRDRTISFEQFILTIFSLLNLCYPDKQSLGHSGPQQESDLEETEDTDLRTTAGNRHHTKRTLPTQEKLMLPLAQPHHGGEAATHYTVDPEKDAETHSLPREVAEPEDLKNQHVEEDKQDAAPVAPATEDDGAQVKINKPSEGSSQTSSPTTEIYREEDKPFGRQSDTKLSDPFGEKNLGQQKEVARKPSEDWDAGAEKRTQKHSERQDPSLQREEHPSSENADMAEQATARKMPQTQKSKARANRAPDMGEPGQDADGMPPKTTNSDASEEDGEVSETLELPARESEHETGDQSIQSGDRNVAKISRIAAERKEEARLRETQTEHERKSQPPAPEAQTQEEKYQELPGSRRESDAEKGSGTRDLSSEENNENLPGIKEVSAHGAETRCAEEDLAEALGISKDSSAVEEMPREPARTRKLAPLGKQSPGEDRRAAATDDPPVRKEEGADEEGSQDTLNRPAPEILDMEGIRTELQVQGPDNEGEDEALEPQGTLSRSPEEGNIAPSKAYPEEEEPATLEEEDGSSQGSLGEVNDQPSNESRSLPQEKL